MGIFPGRSKYNKKKSSDFHDKNRKINKALYIKRCRLFSMLSDWELSSISRLTRLVEIKRDEVVYKKGEVGSAFYIIVSGRFEAYLENEGDKEPLAYLKQGSYFGEMSLLSDKEHSATVKARADSLVLEISKDNFKNIVESNASVSLEISRVLSSRLKEENAGQANRQKLLRSDVLSVYSLHRESEQTDFSINLAASLYRETDLDVVLIDMSSSGRIISDRLRISSQAPSKFFEDFGQDLDRILTEHMIRHNSGIQLLSLPSRSSKDLSGEFLTHLLNRLAVDYRFIVVNLPDQDSQPVHQVILHSDTVFIATDNNLSTVTEVQEMIKGLDNSLTGSDDKVKVVMTESVLGYSPTLELREELFGVKDCFYLPKTKSMFAEHQPKDEIHVLTDPDSSYSRRVRQIARKVSNNLVGLALGSGAALGFSHIGVLKVLMQEKIPIDFVSGSSMGGLVASFFATGHSVQEMEAIAKSLSNWRLLSLADVSIFPWRGLIIGNQIVKYLRRYLKDITFEQTTTPLYLVGANIHDRRPVIMNSGSILDALRASIAIPGIFQPVRIRDQVVIDGGVLDPLPIAPLLGAGVNKIIAVDVLPTPDDIRSRKEYQARLDKRKEALILKKNFLQQSLYAMKKKMNNMLLPNFIDIVVNSMQAMEHQIAESVAPDADVLIRPDMHHIHWVEFNRSKELIFHGEEAAQSKISELHALVKQQTI